MTFWGGLAAIYRAAHQRAITDRICLMNTHERTFEKKRNIYTLPLTLKFKRFHYNSIVKRQVTETDTETKTLDLRLTK